MVVYTYPGEMVAFQFPSARSFGSFVACLQYTKYRLSKMNSILGDIPVILFPWGFPRNENLSELPSICLVLDGGIFQQNPTAA